MYSSKSPRNGPFLAQKESLRYYFLRVCSLLPQFRISMAAIDPDQIPEFGDDMDASKPPRATLKIIRAPGMEESDDESDEDDEDDDSSDEEEVNGGPSDPSKSKKLRAAAVMKELEDAMDDGDSDGGDEEVDIKSAISKLLKGKAKATEDDEESDISDDLEAEETVICTLDPEKVCVNPVDHRWYYSTNCIYSTTNNPSISLFTQMNAFSSRSPAPTLSISLVTTLSLLKEMTTMTRMRTTIMICLWTRTNLN